MPAPLARRFLAITFALFATSTGAFAFEQPTTPAAKPAETKPAETKPVDSKPADSKPVEVRNGGKAEEVTYAHIELAGALAEGAPLPGLFGELSESLGTVVTRIEKVAADPKITGLILKLKGLTPGSGQIATLQAAIGKVRAAGKPVHCTFDEGTNLSYVVAAACDEVIMPEPAVLMLIGLRAEVTFYKNLFEKVGVQADMLRVGAFKSAAEPYTRSEMSPEFREEMEAVLDDRYNQLVGMIAKARKLSVEQVRKVIDEGPQTSAVALASGLIDRIAYEDEIEAGLSAKHPGKKVVFVKRYGRKKLDTDFSGFTGMVKFMELVMGVEQPKRKSTTPKVAVIYAVGPIMSGSSQSDLFGESTLGSDTMIKAFREAAKDDSVKAVVLRVNSPGGSALASDLMWRELKLLKKPLVVSMGDVAASGGYYIAMGADRIFAEAGTITGSIGVLGGKLALGGLYEKLGMTTTVLSKGKNAGIFSTTTGFDETERAAMQKMLNDIYKQFTSKAAAGRKMPLETLEKLAGGRIYTGDQALKVGLVDEIGSLEQAIAAAKSLAGIKPEDKVERLELPKAVSPFEQLLGPLDPNAEARSAAKDSLAVRLATELAPGLTRELRQLRLLELFARERTLFLLPYTLRIE